jgi:manganese/zinc/iron transport system ATP- binding protein
MTTESETALQISDLRVSYDREVAVDSLSFSVERGDLVAIVGPNGAGKSTLIKAVVGAQPIDAGRISVCGRTGDDAVESVTYVPQHGDIDWEFPVTVEDVILQGRYGSMGLLGRMSDEDQRLVDEAVEAVDVGDLLERQIGELSGGQRQRVFLARALAQKGEVYLLDEPFVGVDAATERAIADVLRQLSAEGRAVLVVHHDLSTIREYFDKVLLMNASLVAFGAVDEVFTRDNLQETYGGHLTMLEQSGPVVVS